MKLDQNLAQYGAQFGTQNSKCLLNCTPDARGDHVGAPDGLDLLQAPELVVVENLVKVD